MKMLRHKFVSFAIHLFFDVKVLKYKDMTAGRNTVLQYVNSRTLHSTV